MATAYLSFRFHIARPTEPRPRQPRLPGCAVPLGEAVAPAVSVLAGVVQRAALRRAVLQRQQAGADIRVRPGGPTVELSRVQEAAMRQPIESPAVRTTDPDLAEQAKPGHGVPSQDPDPAAQSPIEEAHAKTEEKSVFVGAGALAGAATGAAVGTAVAGPVGVVVGGAVGAVAGAIGGAAAGSLREAAKDPRH